MPDVPNAGRLVELEYAVIEDRKVRALLRDVSSIEQQARACPRATCAAMPSATHHAFSYLFSATGAAMLLLA